ncbi:MAG: mechanosensitive ion channel family protein [Spirochaetaceae bacterium]|jgi:small-conductance mechanosensitive channel|nr:mechanosensitive ion channel family protein [Spirochaetaceae bacterium]
MDSDLHFFIRLGIGAAIVVAQVLLIWGTFHAAKLLQRKIINEGEKRLKSLHFKNLVLLESKQIISIICFIIGALKWLLAAVQLIITIPNIFRLFEKTRELASTLFGYIITPFKNFALAFINYIPNLFTIAVIIIISRYTMQTLKFFSAQISKKKLVIPGFYAEWATPTFNILRVLVIAFTIAIVFPHLPNSDSDIFKGVSVLVGVLFSLGSSSVIGNLISGIVMTYMRPFQVGDRITINNTTGFVIERGPMVVRIRTHKNEIVSFPNQMVMNNSIVNYTAPTVEGYNGLIMHTSITMGYDVPWQKVHEILLAAADKTSNTEKTPAPFVNQLKLDDFYCWYEINVYTKKVEMLPAIYSELYANIQIGFAENGISMYAPHFQVEKRVAEI